MGKTCRFSEATFTVDSLAAGWEMCLKILESYTRLSSVARRSYCILQQGARRLAPFQHDETGHGHRRKQRGHTDQPSVDRIPVGHQSQQQQPIVHGVETTEAHTLAITELTTGASRPLLAVGIQRPADTYKAMSPGLLPFLDSDLQLSNLEELDDSFWLGDSGAFNWSLMPSIPQSRALSPGFGL